MTRSSCVTIETPPVECDAHFLMSLSRCNQPPREKISIIFPTVVRFPWELSREKLTEALVVKKMGLTDDNKSSNNSIIY